MFLVAVPNFSEGRDDATVGALEAAVAAQARLLDVHRDADHNRSVLTIVGEPDSLVDSLVAAAAVASERIDLRRHEGVHPCIGAADVLPIVPLRPGDMPAARVAARTLAQRVGEELGIPVFLYGALAGGLRPAYFRRGCLAALQQRIADGELRPDFGPPRLHPSAGATLVGARPPLVAFNVNLDTCDVEVARAVAAVVREAGGGFPGVRALGLALERAGCVQVSMNIEDWQAAPPHVVVARIREEAARHGVELRGSELVGLLPAGAAALAAAGALALPALAPDRILESRAFDASWIDRRR